MFHMAKILPNGEISLCQTFQGEEVKGWSWDNCYLDYQLDKCDCLKNHGDSPVLETASPAIISEGGSPLW